MVQNIHKVSRFEVIDETGRVLVVRPCVIEDLSFQDGGRTLKVFVRRTSEPHVVGTEMANDSNDPAGRMHPMGEVK